MIPGPVLLDIAVIRLAYGAAGPRIAYSVDIVRLRISTILC